MIRLAILRALPAFLFAIQTVSSTPLTFGRRDLRNETQTNGTVWPTDVADLAHDQTWPDFTDKTSRWSSYEAPTFDQVFLPESEEDLSLGVSRLSFASNPSMLAEICRLKVRDVQLQYLSSNKLPWLAKSGGHGYSPTLHSIQDAVLINLENFNYVRVEDDGTATVGTGALFQDLLDIVGAAGRELSKSFPAPKILCSFLTLTQP